MDEDNGQEYHHILDGPNAPLYRRILAGEVRCARCGTLITLVNQGLANWGEGENGEAVDLEAYCYDCMRIVTRMPES